ncbi:MAG: alpha-L-fucosidase [Phycisphaerae bacterium]|nr:alpha-L-fucosidase [Phycisphaerae bacterium]
MSNKTKPSQTYTPVHKYRISQAIVFMVSSFLLIPFCAQTIAKSALPETAEQRDERMQWWREARFGMFIHWGVYSVPAGTYKGKQIPGIGEWIMENANIPVAEYEQFAKPFNPVKFNADQWVQIAGSAGMKYIVITSKHHDGFCLWDSKVSKYDIMDTAPFKRDILKELSVACKKHGIRLCFYHSIMDWHHPDAQAPFYPNYNDDSRTNPNFSRYVQNYLKPQLKELITNYGPLGVLWFDGEWIKDWTEQQGIDLYNYVRSLQPDIIINNRVSKGRKSMQGMTKEGYFAGDFGTPEQEIPPMGLPGVDWETCMTMNDTWGFKSYDDNWKSKEDLIRKLVDIASKGGNFLLNVGPTSEGLIPEASVERLAAMGEWMAKNSESIYGTTASPFEKLPWGRCTAKPGKLYLHVFDWPKDGELKVPMPRNDVQMAYLLAHKNRAELLLDSDDSGNLVVTVPRKAPDVIDTVVLLEMEAEAIVIPQAEDGSIVLKASDAVVRGTNARYESGGGKDNIGYWTNPDDYVIWRFKVNKTETFNVAVTLACATGSGGSEYVLAVGGQELAGTVKDTGDWTSFVTEKLGTVKITKPGTYNLSLKPKSMPRGAVMNLKSVTLVPIKK